MLQINEAIIALDESTMLLTNAGWKRPNEIAVGDSLYRKRDATAGIADASKYEETIASAVHMTTVGRSALKSEYNKHGFVLASQSDKSECNIFHVDGRPFASSDDRVKMGAADVLAYSVLPTKAAVELGSTTPAKLGR